MVNRTVTAYEGSENYIFVSYAHKDTEEVFPIMESLRRRGYRLWYDDGIAPGSEWPEDIARHLNGSSMVIAFVSDNSMASVNCRREINFALSKQKPFLSVVLNPTEMPLGMELQLSAQQSVLRYNYRSDEKFIEKICACPDLECCREAAAPVVPPVPVAPPVWDNAVPPVSDIPAPVPNPAAAKKKRGPIIAVCALVLVAVLIGVLFLFTGKDAQTPAPETITVYAIVPEYWNDLHCWAWSTEKDVFDQWPGAPLSWDGTWYSIEIPDWAVGVLVNSGDFKTEDIPVASGSDVWIVVGEQYFDYFYQEPSEAEIAILTGG